MIKQFLIAILAVFLPIKTALLVTGLLIALDFILGIAAAKKAKTPITSNRMRDTLGKVLAYESTIMISYLMQHYLMGDLLPVVNIACTYIAMTEGTSVLENIETLTGQPVLSAIIAKINGMKGN